MMFKFAAAGFIAALGFASPAMAASLSINSIDGVWQNATPSVDGEGTNQIRWGAPAYDNGPSGYDFDPSGDMTVLDETSFVLGTFTHLNFPILAPGLTNVDLALSFMIEGVSDAITTVFSFDHWETHNEASVCANGDGQRVGVNNSFGCADLVSATLNDAQSETFDIDGVTYVLDITGFQHEGELMTSFWTEENATNEAHLLGSFRVVPTEVPLPASGMLLLGGLAGIAMVRRRRK
ncbi:MAG: THxN family PEP-CTERM protein [Paracoccaceae bacterium]